MPIKVAGIAIRPGVSRNRRRYTAETLAKANTRLAARLADPAAIPATMRSHHAAGDDSTHIAGSLTRAELRPDGAIAYEGVLADTAAGRDIAALSTPDGDGHQHLKNVSIRGWWLGPVTEDDQGNETGSDLEIDGLDFTANPGVPDATVSATKETVTTTETVERHLIFESVEDAVITTIEAATAVTPGASDYADPGYQTDKKKRYPVDTKAHALAAWSFVNQAKNQKGYTAPQLGRIKGKIKSALKKFGVDIKAESFTLAGALTEAIADEAYASVSTGGYGKQANISLSHHNVDPANTKAMITALAGATVAAMSSLDPDGDGDVDGVNDDDDDSCPSCGGDLPADASYCPSCGQRTESVGQQSGAVQEREATVPETTESATTGAETTIPAATTTATETTETAPPARNLTDADIAALAAALKPATETAPTGTETTVTETAEQKTVREATEAREALRLEVRNELLEEARKEGLTRKGLVRATDETFNMADLPQADQDQMFKDGLVGLLAPQLATQTD